MKQRPVLLYVAIVLVLILAAAVIWLLTAPLPGGRAFGSPRLRTGTCPGLDLRYGYDPAVFTPAPYDGRAEFPLRLDAGDWSFYGKRLRGVATMLVREPQSQLFDFVGTEDADVFEEYYGLQRTSEVYEDATIGGQLALHNMLTFEYTPQSTAWPTYFPESVKAGKVAHLEGWALFSDRDLFYFYAIAPQPLTDAQREACRRVLESLEFNALMGPVAGDQEAEETPGANKEDEDAAGEDSGPIEEAPPTTE